MKHKQKLISTSLESDVKRFQRFLQTQENIKYGRKAKTISFVDATKRTKDLANFIITGGKR